MHYLGFIVLSWFDLGIHVHKAPAVQEDRKPLPEKIVLKADDRPAPDVAEAVEKPDIEQLEEIPPELPDLEDMLPEQVVIAPGETARRTALHDLRDPGIPFPENAAGGHECRREGVARTLSA